MKLIKQSYEIIPQAPGLEGIYKQIEKAGRTCYKSEDKITEDSAKKFVERMINSKHTAMLEHGTVYLFAVYNHESPGSPIYKYRYNKYSKWNWSDNGEYVTTNYRVLVENGWLDDLKYVCEPTEYHEKRVTVKFTTNQGILREFTRHRSFSFAVESTRYCNYNKDKFDYTITFIIPNWCNYVEEGYAYYHDGTCIRTGLKDRFSFAFKSWTKPSKDEDENLWRRDLEFLKMISYNERSYFSLLQQGLKPEEARGILPLDTKCDMIMTGFVSDWKYFFDLRALGTTGKPHPQAKELAEPLMEEFKTLNYI